MNVMLYDPKSETRRPKEIRNPKSEIRSPKGIPSQQADGCPAVFRLPASDFGFRISSFLRISVFGFRISPPASFWPRV